jgi:hypothetical protein
MIVVLASVHYDLMGNPGKSFGYGGGFDELGPRSYDCENLLQSRSRVGGFRSAIT